MRFEVRSRSGDSFQVRARDYQHAASVVARRAHGRRASARQLIDVGGLSGYFQSYLPIKGGGLTSAGEPYHIREV